MKRKSLLVLLTFIALSITAQYKFGYVSYKEIVKSLPEYGIVEAHLDELQAKYEAEMERSDREFNQKYTDFIEEQSQLPDNIRIKRHKELQELMEKSVAFKKEINSTMCEARAEMMKPLYEKIEEVAMKLCIEEGLDYILNTDERSYLVINPERGKDLSEQLLQALNVQNVEINATDTLTQTE